MSKDDQVPFEDEGMEPLDDFDEDTNPDESSDISMSSSDKIDAETQARINARHEIERRNELKALKDELDEWDEFDEEDL